MKRKLESILPGEISITSDMQMTPPFYGRKRSEIIEGFPGGSAGKESICNAGDLGSIPGLGRSSGEGKGYPFQYSVLENSMDSIVQGVAKSQIQLSDFHLVPLHFLPLEWYHLHL